MIQNEYAAQFEEIDLQLEALYEKITAADYCDRTPRKDFQRDIAAALELGQKQQDLYSQIIDDIGSDMEYHKEFCAKFDEIMRRHGNIELAKS